MTAFSMNHFGQDFHFFSLAAIFSKFSDGIKENTPNHKTSKQIFINSCTCAIGWPTSARQ